MTLTLWIAAAGLLTPYVPHVASAWARQQQFGAYDNHEPRLQSAKLEGWGRRAVAAHQNAFEALPPLLFAVLVVEQVGADGTASATLTGAWLIFRLMHAAMYLLDRAAARSLAWTFALLCVVGLLALAAAHGAR